ncbi:PREDICTED: uncharacterized protein At4g02000-like [Ipomoea nil]|uniref:uncharacterized protein At4g02000-like n=1 Tax=Ipomoea nil TaxID=35883 RepID=UPI000901C525|nr:PREDICTED: uncharacterized protein At4g02000-like [Ipomoea nil]
MDVRQIEERCAELTIAEEEINGLEAPDPPIPIVEASQYNLIGRFLTDRTIKFDHMQQVMALVWRPVKGMCAVALTEDLFLFQFPHPKDRQRVLDDGPWSFENHILVCENVPPEMRPEDVQLDSITFWVQIHGLPAVYVTSDFIAKIGNYVGSFVAIDPGNFGGSLKSFHRIRVKLMIASPLKRRMKLLRKDGTIQWITFRYERLSIFCLCCGLLGHTDKFCSKVYEEGIQPEAFPFGSWMRAGQRRQPKPVGAKWLLPSLPQQPEPHTPPGPSPLELVAMEENVGLQGELKRRREEDETTSDVRGEDVMMTETSKNLTEAGLDSQARPAK